MGSHPVQKVAAAVSAVLQYLADEQAAAQSLAAPAPPLPPPAPALAPWGLAGRQESMAFRHLWQRRIPRSW